MTDPDQMLVPSPNGTYGLTERLGGHNGYSVLDGPPVNSAEGLVSLGFIKEAIGRAARLWCGLGLVGLLLGGLYFAKSPPSYQAQTSLLLTSGPYENIDTAANNDQAMALSRTVAQMAAQKLGLPGNGASLLGAYSATPITERIIRITFSAKTSSQALAGASAVATSFLQFRANEMRAEQQLVLASLEQQISQASHAVSSLEAQITQLQAEPGPAGRQSRLKTLTAQKDQLTEGSLPNLTQAVASYHTVTQPATAAAVNGSVVLDPAALLARSRLKPLVLEAGVGLVMGLVTGLSVAAIRAVVSDRLRRRDNIARAIGAPVRVSVGVIRPGRRLPGRGGSSLAGNADVQRIVAYLGRTAGPGEIANLAVVPVDDVRVPAACLVSLALTSASQGKRVVLADLSGGAAARLLGVAGPGIHQADAAGASLVVAVPGPADVVPVGPLDRGALRNQRSTFGTEVGDACTSADLLLTLAVLDPALGGEHLATWCAGAVAMVTAGQSSWTRIHAAGEMVKMSGTRLISAVLVGADKTDESLGTVPV